MPSRKVRTTFVCNDLHFPYADAKAVRVFLEAVRVGRPDAVVLAGDIWDCYQLSKFGCDPARITTLQDEVDQGTDFLAAIRRKAPKTDIVVLEGNHEARLAKLVCDNPKLSSLRAVDPVHFFGLDKVAGATWVPLRKVVKVGDVTLTHGHLVRKHGAYSARAMLESYGESGISGHTHRIGCTERRVAGQVQAWRENGCLCDLNPDYLHEGTADWAHGFAVCREVDGLGWTQVEQVEIRDGWAYTGGRVYAG